MTSEQIVNEIFADYMEAINTGESVQETSLEVFKMIHKVIKDPNNAEKAAGYLHEYLVVSMTGLMQNIIANEELLVEGDLANINNNKMKIKFSRLVSEHVKENIEYYIGMESSDENMIDFFRNFL